MKMAIAALVVIVAGVSVAQEKPKKTRPADMTTAERLERRFKALERRFADEGGIVAVPDSQKGRIVFADGQEIVPADQLKDVVATIRMVSKLNVDFVKDGGESVSVKTASSRKAALKGDFVIYLTRCDECDNMMVLAPEAGWAILNAAAITKGAKNDAFKAARMRKMMQRAFYSVCGSMNSRFPGSLMGAVRTPEDLDRKTDDLPPIDVQQRTGENLKDMGVTPVEYVSYSEACRQGWAAAPTNDIQKAAWDKVHELPTKPIKIVPESQRNTVK